jgi:hypothetical protein
MAIYIPHPAGALQPGQKVRKLKTVGPSVIDPDGYDYPWTVDHVQFLGNERVRVWGFPHGARVSVESPSVYGNYAELGTVELLV